MVTADARRLADSAHLGQCYANAALGEIHRQAEPDGTSPNDQDLGVDATWHGSNCAGRRGRIRELPTRVVSFDDLVGVGEQQRNSDTQANFISTHQYTLAPENLITLAHFSVNSAMYARNSEGELVNTV